MSSLRDSSSSEEAFARVVWSAHILARLSRQRSQPALVSPTPLSEHGEEEGEEDLDSNVEAQCVPVDEPIRIKFLNRMAETSSHTRGWHHVSVTALREYEDRVEVDVSRNSGFYVHGKNGYSGEDGIYFASFEAFMASQVECGKVACWEVWLRI